MNDLSIVVPAQAGTHTPCRCDVVWPARDRKLSGYGSPPARDDSGEDGGLTCGSFAKPLDFASALRETFTKFASLGRAQ